MNSALLKIIALITMMIDHYGAIFYPDVMMYRIIGRLAFPIYCFLLVEGYLHTHDVKKYAKRLLLFALISEFPFDLAFYGELGFAHQNIFFTLLIGLAAIYFIDHWQKYGVKPGYIFLFASILAMILAVDYNIAGIIYIIMFYFTRNTPKNYRILHLAIILFFVNLLMLSQLQQFALLSLPLIYLYNGKPGPKSKLLQWLFYAAYPLHLLVYYFISHLN